MSDEATIELAGQRLRAVSVAGLETCLELPEWKLCFDIGRCPPTATRLPRVLFSHAHADHMGGVIHHCATRDMMGMSPAEYWLPRESAEAFHAMLDAWRRLDGSELRCTVHPVGPGDEVMLDSRRWARVFRAIHRVPSVGYVLGERVHRLIPELVGAPREEIVARRRRGEVIHRSVDRPLVAFCGDTTIDVIEREAGVRQAKLLLLEVTFLDDRVSVEACRRMGHVHLDEVVERAELFENDAILFTHASARYSNAEMRRILERRLPPILKERARILQRRTPWSAGR